jgi:hypothetical protein
VTGRLRAFWAVPPAVLRPIALRVLLRRVAAAFAAPPPVSRGLTGNDLLRAYAAFSNARAELLLTGHGDLDAARRDLWTGAHRIGRALRWGLGVRTTADAMLAARTVYRMLDIDLLGLPPGGVMVTRCSFARIYAPHVCMVMSSLDAGLFAGLTGGRRLTFSQRITEGAPACLATLQPREGVAT